MAAVVWGLVVVTGDHRPAPPGTTTYLSGELYGGPAVLATFDPATGAVGKLVETGADAVAPGGRTAVELDTDRNRVFLVDLRTGRTGPPIRVGWDPDAVAFAPDGHTAYVVDDGTEGADPHNRTLPGRGTAATRSRPSTWRRGGPGAP